jgi:hypothetical protein
VAIGTVCHSVSRWSSSSGIVTMGDHITERMSTGPDKPWEHNYPASSVETRFLKSNILTIAYRDRVY